MLAHIFYAAIFFRVKFLIFSVYAAASFITESDEFPRTWEQLPRKRWQR